MIVKFDLAPMNLNVLWKSQMHGHVRELSLTVSPFGKVRRIGDFRWIDTDFEQMADVFSDPSFTGVFWFDLSLSDIV